MNALEHARMAYSLMGEVMPGMRRGYGFDEIGQMNETGNPGDVAESPGAILPDCKQTSEVKA